MTDATIGFIVNRSDLAQSRWVSGPAPPEVAIGHGQVLAEIEKFAVTASYTHPPYGWR